MRTDKYLHCSPSPPNTHRISCQVLEIWKIMSSIILDKDMVVL